MAALRVVSSFTFMRLAAFILCLLSVIACGLCIAPLLLVGFMLLTGFAMNAYDPGMPEAVSLIYAIFFLVIGFYMFLPLAYGIPMTVFCYRAYKGTYEPSVGFSVCVLLFLNTIAGILLLIDCDARQRKPGTPQ